MAEGVTDAEVERLARRMAEDVAATNDWNDTWLRFDGVIRRLLEQGWTPPARPDPAVEVAYRIWLGVHPLLTRAEFDEAVGHEIDGSWEAPRFLAAVRDVPTELLTALAEHTPGGGS